MWYTADFSKKKNPHYNTILFQPWSAKAGLEWLNCASFSKSLSLKNYMVYVCVDCYLAIS